MTARKAYVGAASAFLAGAGFVVTSGVLHGTALVAVQAAIAAVSAVVTGGAVYRADNTEGAGNHVPSHSA